MYAVPTVGVHGQSTSSLKRKEFWVVAGVEARDCQILIAELFGTLPGYRQTR
jgi:hypothetical protein